MNSLQPAFTPSHPAAGLRRLLVVVLAVLLLGVFTTLPALASGSGTWTVTGSLHLARWEATATLLQNGNERKAHMEAVSRHSPIEYSQASYVDHVIDEKMERNHMPQSRPIARDSIAKSTCLLMPTLFLALTRTIPPKMSVETVEIVTIHTTKNIMMCQREKIKVSRKVTTAKKAPKNPN